MADTIETRISMPSVELNKGIRKTFFETLFVTGNEKAHRIDVPLLRNGQPVSIPSGAKVEGYLTRYADDVTVRNPGTASGNVVSVTLEKGCYAKTGAFALTIQVTVDGVTNTVFWGESSIFSSAADTVIDGDYIIYDLAELLKRIDAMKAATEAANTAATNADKATEAAETATTNADSAAKAANTAATNADNATEAANTAATNADNATKTANTAAEKINNMTVQVSGLDAGTAPTANLELVDGHYNLSFAIPKGDKGNTGATGATPRITVKVVTGEPGTDASVTQGGTAEAPIITLTIPRGDTGSLGNLTICGKAPDEAGKVELTAADVGALSGTDATLTEEGKAADAKKVGTKLSQLKSETAYVTGNARNGLYRGKNLGELGSETEWATFLTKYQVPQGLFVTADKSDALYLGDYVTIKNAGAYSGEWMIAGFNTHKNVGDNLDAVDGVSNAGSVNHIAMVPRGEGFEYGTKMNSTNTTSGGYAGSAMRTHLNETVVPALAGSLGKRLLTRRVMLANAVDAYAKSSGYSGRTGVSNGWAWHSSRAELMNEMQVFGARVWSGGFDIGEAAEKLAVFNFVTPAAFSRGAFWLRSVASSTLFCFYNENGEANCYDANGDWLFVRPLIMVG